MMTVWSLRAFVEHNIRPHKYDLAESMTTQEQQRSPRDKDNKDNKDISVTFLAQTYGYNKDIISLKLDERENIPFQPRMNSNDRSGSRATCRQHLVDKQG